MPVEITDKPRTQRSQQHRFLCKNSIFHPLPANRTELLPVPQAGMANETNENSRISPPSNAEDAQHSSGAALTGKRAMICEDEGITLLQLRKVLIRSGLQVVGVATNGQDGVELALRERPEIVLMDIRMPMMNGLDAARLILAAYTPCIVILSAFSETEYREQAQRIGVAGYITKPITSSTLAYQLQEAYDDYRASK